MSMFQYKTEQFLPINIEKAWKFFSSPKNLKTITPDELDFKILTDIGDEEIYEGMKIDYMVKPLFKIPVRWQTEIIKIKKLRYFTDRQLKGPYKTWEHKHTFITKKDGVLMQDKIDYKLPFGVIGNALHALLVRKKIEKIFTYRKNILEKIFVTNGNVLN